LGNKKLPSQRKGREHNSRGTTLLVTFVACDRSWLFVAWEPPTPSYLFVTGLSSADRSVARSPFQVCRAYTIPRFAASPCKSYYSTSTRACIFGCGFYSIIARRKCQCRFIKIQGLFILRGVVRQRAHDSTTVETVGQTRRMNRPCAVGSPFLVASSSASGPHVAAKKSSIAS
jgi:hypothetical protein